ncbi:MAG: acylphosphatase [Pirellulaceae bacterium]|nr:acylphosphatase [Pirellulaceae bacterium]
MERQIKVVYHGNVQGVGFRYKTSQIAKAFQIVGYVKNLMDGSVELVVQGEKTTLSNFLTEIQYRLANHIKLAEEVSLDIDSTLTEFKIRH